MCKWLKTLKNYYNGELNSTTATTELGDVVSKKLAIVVWLLSGDICEISDVTDISDIKHIQLDNQISNESVLVNPTDISHITIEDEVLNVVIVTNLEVICFTV